MQQEKQIQEQMSIFDFLAMPSGRTLTEQEHREIQKERTSESSLKNCAKSKTKMPLFLDLRTGNGNRAEVSWEKGTVWLGGYTMLNTLAFPKGEEDYVFSLTLMGTPLQKWFLNCSEKPLTPTPSRLSEILEANPDPKYNLSTTACQGILNRANRRGKKLPEILEMALKRQATPLKLGGGAEFDRYGKRAGKGALIQTELSGTLGVSQDQTLIQANAEVYGISSQGGMAVVQKTNEHKTYQKVTGTLNPGAHAGSYNGQDAYNDMLIVEPSNWDGSQVTPTLTARNAGGGTEDARQGKLQRSDRPDDGEYP